MGGESKVELYGKGVTKREASSTKSLSVHPTSVVHIHELPGVSIPVVVVMLALWDVLC